MPHNPHADFTPTLKGYSGQEPFRFWCQLALPLTYDDSLSYYELLNKVVTYLNHTIEDVSNMESNVGDLHDAYVQLQKYVNDYFDNIDIEAELRNVLDKMALDGSLDALLDPLVANHLPELVEAQVENQIGSVVEEQIGGAVAEQIGGVVNEQLPPLVSEGIPEEVSEWLTENVDPVGSAVMVDTSLTISGAAADAKATGDTFNNLKESLGMVNGMFGFSTRPGYVNQYGAILNLDTETRYCITDYFKIEGGSNITVKGANYNNRGLITFYDINKNPISQIMKPEESGALAEVTTDVPNNAVYAIITFEQNNIPNNFFKYNSFGQKFNTREGTYVRTASTTNNWVVSYTGMFDANDEIVVTENAEITPKFIPYTGEHTVTVSFPKSESFRGSQYYSAGWLSGKLTVIPHVVSTINVGNDGNDNSNTYVKTLERAINSGATEINLLSDMLGKIPNTPKLILNGNGHKLLGSTALTTKSYNNIKRAQYSADENITACFVDKTKALQETITGSEWKGNKLNIAIYSANYIKLYPLETLTEVENTENSFTWDDGYFYINTNETNLFYVIESTNAFNNGEVTIYDLTIEGYYSNCIGMINGKLELNGCVIKESINSNNIYAENSVLFANNCEVCYSWNDGINCHGRGHSKIIDCYCHDNSDDGCSQHDECTGVIIGGEFCYSGKSGIASPTNKAKIDIYNAYIHDNTSADPLNRGRGIWASGTDLADGITVKIFNCIITNNSLGIRVNRCTAITFGNKLSNNSTNINATGGSLINLD